MLSFKILLLLGVVVLNACHTQARHAYTEHVTKHSTISKRQGNVTSPQPPAGLATVNADAWCATLDPEDTDAAQAIWEGP